MIYLKCIGEGECGRCGDRTKLFRILGLVPMCKACIREVRRHEPLVFEEE